MDNLTFKEPDPCLTPILKTVKTHYDNPSICRRYKLILRRQLFLTRDTNATTWYGEASHQLALLCENEGERDEAIRLITETLTRLEPDEYLARARAMRDLGRLVAEAGDPLAGLLYIEEALALHDQDFRNLKGRRQRRITESYAWRVKLLHDSGDNSARKSLINYAVNGCRGCCIRDQHYTVVAAYPYAEGIQKQLLEVRLIEIFARKQHLPMLAASMTKFVIRTELRVLHSVVRILARKEQSTH